MAKPVSLAQRSPRWKPGFVIEWVSSGPAVLLPVAIAAVVAGTCGLLLTLDTVPLVAPMLEPVAKPLGILNGGIWAFGTLVGLEIGAALLYGFGILLEEQREFRFTRVLGVTGLAYLAMSLGQLVRTILVLNGVRPAVMSLAWLVKDASWYLLLSHFGVFQLIGLLLAGVGYQHITGFRWYKAMSVVVGLWLVFAFMLLVLQSFQTPV